MNYQCRTAARSHDEGLLAESANEVGHSVAMAVGRQVTLVPRQAKRRIWQLNHESIELRLAFFIRELLLLLVR